MVRIGRNGSAMKSEKNLAQTPGSGLTGADVESQIITLEQAGFGQDRSIPQHQSVTWKVGQTVNQIPATAPTDLHIRRIGLVLFGVFASWLLLDSGLIEPAHATQTSSSPPFVYRQGPQGVGYYASPAPASSPVQTAPAAVNRPRTVGPGVRNWATGRRSPLHRPWMQARS